MNLKIKKDNAIAAYESADEKGKKLLEDLFPGEFYVDPYIKACQVLGITPKPELADKSDEDEVSIDAYRRLIICVRAKNILPDGSIWVPNYDGNEYHYFPYFKPGFGFSYSITNYWFANSFVGARLEYRTRELSDQGAAEFKQYYIDFSKLTAKN